MSVRFLVAGDKAISVEFGKEISLELNAKVRMLQRELEEHPLEGVTETVPTYSSLIVHYRPEIIRRGPLVEALRNRLGRMRKEESGVKVIKEIPVLYGGAMGPDLEECAALERVSPAEIIRMHSEHEYYVYMLGFAPGHPYMARFEEPFHFKRRATPRVRIPARSVVAQMNLSDLIPFDQPCGWNIIGSTPLDICDFQREDPFLIHAGEWVKHIPVTPREYEQIRGDVKRGVYHCKSRKEQISGLTSERLAGGEKAVNKRWELK